MDTKNILIIEDDNIVAKTIERCLRGDEFRIRIANSGVEGLKAARRNPPDIIILDVVMPGMDGYAVCEDIRADPVLEKMPILFLTARAKDEEKIHGLQVGGDDYLSKPFNLDELTLRIRALLRRSEWSRDQITPRAEDEQKSSTELTIGDYTLNTDTFELATPHYGDIRLTPVQYDLLYHLMSHAGEIFSPARLLDEVWDYPSDSGSPDLVRVHIKNLRERIEENPRSPKFILTIPGYGYKVVNPTQDAE
ncbi:MAG: response regulator transcription factor [Anaerolineaceae bacterium]|jgi:DNA-binding response OmpR family regulator|nr:response regulator transcription factor [Anaerolineaceae bacterium]